MLFRLHRQARPSSKRRALHLEVLEDRNLLSSTLVVTTASDLAGHSGTSLRDAVAQANTDAAAGQSDTITFAPSLAGATITLAQGQLELSGAGGGMITIDGTSLSSPIAVSGNNASRVFQVDAGVHAAFARLTIEDGAGGIGNAGTLALSDVTVSGNLTGSNGSGGGIANSGSLTVTHSTIAGNRAAFGGGISNTGTASLSDSTISANTAVPYDGGGIDNRGNLLVSGCTFTFNTASDAFDGGGGGGAIYTNGNTWVVNSTFFKNSAGSSTAGNYGDGGAINGGAVVLNCTIVSNSASAPTAFDYFGGGSGGGLYYPAFVVNTIIAGNSATGGGSAINIPPNDGQQQLYGSPGGGHNLIGGNPGVAGLADNGGPTQTMALQGGSPALGAGGAIAPLAAAIDANTTTITIPALPSGINVPAHVLIQIDNEDLLITAITSNGLTVVRGYNGTTAAAHSANTPVYLATDQRGDPRTNPPDIGAVQTPLPVVRTSPAEAPAVAALAQGFLAAAAHYQQYWWSSYAAAAYLDSYNAWLWASYAATTHSALAWQYACIYAQLAYTAAGQEYAQTGDAAAWTEYAWDVQGYLWAFQAYADTLPNG
jgi:hypothetical protein